MPSKARISQPGFCLETKGFHGGDVQTDRNKTKTLTGNKDSYVRFPRLPKNSSMACGSNVLMSKMGFFR